MDRQDKSTDIFENELKKVSNKNELKEYLSNLEKLDAGQYLQKLLDEKKIKKKDIVSRCNISLSQIYKFIDGNRGISRDKLISISCGSGFNVEETNKLLKLAGYNKLYAKNKKDSLIIYSLERSMNVEDIVILLEENDIDFELM